MDVSVPDFREKIDSVGKTLLELKASHIPRILVFNKADKISDEKLLQYKNLFKEAVFISALNGEGIDDLKDRIRKELSLLFMRHTILVPYTEQNILAMVYKETRVLERRDSEDGVYLTIEGFKGNVEKFKQFFMFP